MMDIPRPEHPRPQLYRDSWQNLNGLWDFDFDFSDSGNDRKLYESGSFSQKILVPFCPESQLSGIGYKDFIPAVWYRRIISLAPEQLTGRVLLHFGAVDYFCRIWINGQEAGSHRGGYSSFSLDITPYLTAGDNTLTVYAKDDLRSGRQPSGKQSHACASYGCSYTRTTGIWQTVWLEFVPQTYIAGLKMYTDPANGTVTLHVRIKGCRKGYILRGLAAFEEREAGCFYVKPAQEYTTVTLSLSEVHLWDAGQPHLYSLTLCLYKDEKQTDRVESYFGVRSIEARDGALYLNGRPVFQRLILDQGYYPEGIYTAPTDTDLRRDIILAMNTGFNGARLHQKLFEERYLYWADKAGYLVWEEHASWGLNISSAQALSSFLPEWLEALERDFNHPCIVGWCPFNETNTLQDASVLRLTYLATKAFDLTRPVIDTSGYIHVQTDVFDVHDYDQNPESFYLRYQGLAKGDVFINFPDHGKYEGQPYFISEYGGAWWAPGQEGWGYGQAPCSEEEFTARYRGLTDTLLQNQSICAFCYTQLCDAEQEKNGLYTYERKEKFSPSVYKSIRDTNLQKAGIEK